MWKYIIEYPVFPDPLDPWKIELSPNQTENKGVVEYKSIKAIDYQEDKISVVSFGYDGRKFLTGVSNSNNGTFTLYANTKKMKAEKENFYVYIQLEDDKKHKSPISNRLEVKVSIKTKISNKTIDEEEPKNKTLESIPPVNVEKLYAEAMALPSDKPTLEKAEEAKKNALKQQKDQ